MNGLDWNLDELVGKIMSDLRENSPVSSATSVSEALTRDFANVVVAGKNPKSTCRPDESSDAVLSVDERVLVVDTVLRLAKGSAVRKWRVLPNAVVTPAALDELARLGVELSRGNVERKFDNSKESKSVVDVSSHVTFSASNVTPYTGVSASLTTRRTPDAEPTFRAKVLFATHLPAAENAPRGVVEYLARNAERVEFRLDCLKETTRRVAAEIEANAALKAVVVTHDAAIGSIWANRLKGVRAVVAYSVEQARRDLAAAAANTLIFDPRDLGPYQSRQVVDFFVGMK